MAMLFVTNMYVNHGLTATDPSTSTTTRSGDCTQHTTGHFTHAQMLYNTVYADS
jgi:hypothetical protein